MIIDLQGYKGVYNEFILKEIAALNNGNKLQHFIVKSPYEINKLPLNYNIKQNGWNLIIMDSIGVEEQHHFMM